MPFGFGSSAGAPLPPRPPGDPSQRLLNAIENMSAKLAPPLSGGPGYAAWRPVSLPVIGNTFFFDTEGQPITMLTVQVFAGEVAIGLFDGRGQPQPSIPYFDLAVIGVPVHIPLTTGPYQITLWAVQANTTASFYVHSPAH